MCDTPKMWITAEPSTTFSSRLAHRNNVQSPCLHGDFFYIGEAEAPHVAPTSDAAAHTAADGGLLHGHCSIRDTAMRDGEHRHATGRGGGTAHPTRRAYRRGGRGDPADARIGWLGYGARCGESGGGRHRADGHRRRAAAVRRHSFVAACRLPDGTVDGIAAGDVMDLVSGTPCDASAGTTSSRDESAGGRSCVLARSATAMDAAHDDAMTGGTLITFALTPDEAISIINAQELGPIMAVTAQ